jgi:hypothetical protein
MKKIIPLFFAILASFYIHAQDTFSIVAIDKSEQCSQPYG